jgi:hypothetical protein
VTLLPNKPDKTYIPNRGSENKCLKYIYVVQNKSIYILIQLHKPQSPASLLDINYE